MPHGHIASVTRVVLGDETTADLVATDTVVPVAAIVDFDESGGSVRILGEVYTYSAMDDGEESDVPSITLGSGLADDVPAETTVELWNDVTGDVMVDWECEVIDDVDGGSILATASHALIPMLARGQAPERGDSVTVMVDEDGEWWVTEIHGKPPRLDLSYADPTTIPTQVPTEAPTVSPAVTALGLVDWIVLQTEELEAPTTLLTFQVSTDGSTWDNLNDTPVRSRVRVVKSLPDGSPLLLGTVYHFRTVASNVVGEAPPGTPALGQLDTAAVALVAQQLVTAEVISGFALLGTVHIGGDAFTLSPPGVDPENLAGGLKIQLTNGGLIHLPADGSPAIFSGDAVLQRLEVVENTRLGGTTDVRGPMTLAGVAIPDPTEPPLVQTYYGDQQLPVSNTIGLAAGIGGADWATLGAGFIATVTAGVLTDVALTLGTPVGVTSIGSSYYVLWWYESEWAVSEYDASLDFVGIVPMSGMTQTFSPNRATVGTDGTNVVIASQSQDVDGDWSANVTMTRYDPSDWSVVSTIDIAAPNNRLGGVSYSDAGGEFGGTRWVLHPRDADVRVYDTSGVRQTGEEWPRPYGKQVRGMYDSLAGDHTVVDNAGVVRQLVLASSAPADTYWWSYAWVDSDTHTTLASPETEHERPARAQIRVTCSGPPQEAGAGTHVANRVEVFAAETSGGTKHTQAVLAAAQRGQNFTEIDNGSGGAPGANNFSVPATVLASENGGWWVDGESDGSIGTGTFRDSVDARVAAYTADTVIRDREQLWLFSDGTVTMDATAAPFKEVGLFFGANCTSSSLTNPVNNQELTIGVYTQFAGSTMAWPSNIDWASGQSAPTTNPVGWTVVRLKYRTDDSRWFELSRTTPPAQPLDTDLTAIAALTSAADKVPYATGAGTWAMATQTAFARTLLDDADAATARTTLELGLTGTTANFNAIGNSRNTTGKYVGKQAFNTTLNRPVWATGSTAGSTWVFADGTTAHTPV